MSPQADAFAAYRAFDPDLRAPPAQLWTAGYRAASVSLCALLAEIEWGPWDEDACAFCGAQKHAGHAVACALDAYLSEDRARRERPA